MKLGHKTISELLFPKIKVRYGIIGGSPCVKYGDLKTFYESFENEVEVYVYNKLVRSLAGYAAEAHFSKLNLNTLASEIEELGRLRLYVNEDVTYDAETAYAIVLSYSLNPFVRKSFDLSIKDALYEAYKKIIGNMELFEKNVKIARKYFLGSLLRK